jgi:hypothetical protein
MSSLIPAIVSFFLGIQFAINFYNNLRLDDIMDIISKISSSLCLFIFGFIFLHNYLNPIEECNCDTISKSYQIDIVNNKIIDFYEVK